MTVFYKEADVAHIKSQLDAWLKSVVIGLNLCPFANKPYIKKKVRLSVELGNSEADIVSCLLNELILLSNDSEKLIETTLIAVPNIFQDFIDYNDFLYSADELLIKHGYEGVFQIASFHPQYQFSDTEPTAAENFTNRAPYPLFHIIREESLSEAIDLFPGVEQIPNRNIVKMNALSNQKLKNLFPWYFIL